MAFIKDKTGVRQTATNAAVNLVTAFVQAGFITQSDVAWTEFQDLRDSIYEDLAAIVDADNKAFADADYTPKSQGGGRKATGGKSSGLISLDQARDTVLNFGAFKTLTLGEVFDMPAEQAAEYGYVDKQGNGKPGRQWVSWASKNEDIKADFIRKRALALIESARAASDAA